MPRATLLSRVAAELLPSLAGDDVALLDIVVDEVPVAVRKTTRGVRLVAAVAPATGGKDASLRRGMESVLASDVAGQALFTADLDGCPIVQCDVIEGDDLRLELGFFLDMAVHLHGVLRRQDPLGGSVPPELGSFYDPRLARSWRI